MTRRPSRGHQRPLTGLVASAVLLIGSLAPSASTLALVTDTSSVMATVSADTLDPATNLRCTGLLTCTLAFVVKPTITWTATPDTYATGYDIYRSTTSGSGYVQIDSVVGRTTTTYTDTTVSALSTYYYVVRAHAAVWTSVNSNQVTVIVLL
jgi:hypothetical protein